MELELLKNSLVIIEAEEHTGSGIIISNDGLIASCYHNFYFEDHITPRIIKSIRILRNNNWSTIEYRDNVEFFFKDDEINMYRLRHRDLFFIRLKNENDLADISLSNEVEENDKIRIIAFDKTFDSQYRSVEDCVLTKESFDSTHPDRLRLRIEGHPGFSGGGVFNEKSELIGIINYAREDRNNEIIASIFPDQFIEFINNSRVKTILKQPTISDANIPLSINDLQDKLSPITINEKLTIMPKPKETTIIPLELLSAVALGNTWYEQDSTTIEMDEYPEIKYLLAPFEKQVENNSDAQVCLNEASEKGLLEDDHFKLCMAAYRLGSELQNRHEEANSLLQKIVKPKKLAGALNKKRQKILSLSLNYWPEGYQLLYLCGESLIKVDPRHLTDVYRLEIFNQTVVCDLILGSIWYCNDVNRVPLSQRWAESVGWFSLLPEIFVKLFKGSVDRLQQQWKNVPIADRYPYIKTFRFSGLDDSKLNNFGLAIACSLPKTTKSKLNTLKQSPELQTWLRLMREPKLKKTNVNHIRFLIEIMRCRYSQSEKILSDQAHKALTAPHRDLVEVWEELRDYRMLWVEKLTNKELGQGNMKTLVQHITNCETEAAKLLFLKIAARDKT